MFSPSSKQLREAKPFFTDISFDPLVEYMTWGTESHRRDNAQRLQYESDIILDAKIKVDESAKIEGKYDPTINIVHFTKEQKELLRFIKTLEWGKRRSIQMVNYSNQDSVNNACYLELKKGNTLYSFTSNEAPKAENSPYYFTEAEYESLCRDPEFFSNNEWNAWKIKDHFALPCPTSCTAIATRLVTEDHVAVETRTGFVAEARHLIAPDNSLDRPTLRHMRGGGGQIFADMTCLAPTIDLIPTVSNYANPRLSDQRERDIKEYDQATRGLFLALTYPGSDRQDMARRRTLAESRLNAIALRLVEDQEAMRRLPREQATDAVRRAMEATTQPPPPSPRRHP